MLLYYLVCTTRLRPLVTSTNISQPITLALHHSILNIVFEFSVADLKLSVLTELLFAMFGYLKMYSSQFYCVFFTIFKYSVNIQFPHKVLQERRRLGKGIFSVAVLEQFIMVELMSRPILRCFIKNTFLRRRYTDIKAVK